MNKKFLKVARFELIETIKKPSFWLTTLFFPLFIGVVSYISGASSIEAEENFQKLNEEFETVLVVDDAEILKTEIISKPFQIESSKTKREAIRNLIGDSSLALIYIPEDFLEEKRLEIYYQERSSLLAGMSLHGLANSLIQMNVISQIEDPSAQILLSSTPTSSSFSVTKEGKVIEDQVEEYILPILSLLVFFLSVFISSMQMLQSVSTEKENRMIETILAIVDKKSLITGKLLGLIGVVLLQLVLWIGLSIAIYYFITTQMDVVLPIDFSQMDYSLLPINLFFIVTGFLFFSAVMTGVGAVGTGASDSKNLSSIFIILAIFPIYILQVFITSPNNAIAKLLSYFPFTSFMVLLIRNSLGALSTIELVIGSVLCVVYVVVAIWLAIKLFEIGCLMYNRRPTLKEMWGTVRRR